MSTRSNLISLKFHLYPWLDKNEVSSKSKGFTLTLPSVISTYYITLHYLKGVTPTL